MIHSSHICIYNQATSGSSHECKDIFLPRSWCHSAHPSQLAENDFSALINLTVTNSWCSSSQRGRNCCHQELPKAKDSWVELLKQSLDRNSSQAPRHKDKFSISCPKANPVMPEKWKSAWNGRDRRTVTNLSQILYKPGGREGKTHSFPHTGKLL